MKNGNNIINLKDLSNKERYRLSAKTIKIQQETAPHEKFVDDILSNHWDKIRITDLWWDEQKGGLAHKMLRNFAMGKVDSDRYSFVGGGGPSTWTYTPQVKFWENFREFAKKTGWDPKFCSSLNSEPRSIFDPSTDASSWQWFRTNYTQGNIKMFSDGLTDGQTILSENGEPLSKESLMFLKKAFGKDERPTLEVVYKAGAILEGEEFFNDEIKIDILFTDESQNQLQELDEVKKNLEEEKARNQQIQEDLQKAMQGWISESYKNVFFSPLINSFTTEITEDEITELYNNEGKDLEDLFNQLTLVELEKNEDKDILEAIMTVASLEKAIQKGSRFDNSTRPWDINRTISDLQSLSEKLSKSEEIIKSNQNSRFYLTLLEKRAELLRTAQSEITRLEDVNIQIAQVIIPTN